MYLAARLSREPARTARQRRRRHMAAASSGASRIHTPRRSAASAREEQLRDARHLISRLPALRRDHLCELPYDLCTIRKLFHIRIQRALDRRKRVLGSRKRSLSVPVARTSGPTPTRPRTRLGLFLHALRHIEYLRVAGLNARRTRTSAAPRSTCSARSVSATVGPLFRPMCRAPFDHFCESRCESDTGG